MEGSEGIMLKFLVSGQKIETAEREVIASDQIAFVNIHFTFEGDWKRFHKVVQFTQCSSTYCRVLGTDGLSCLLPSELHAGAVKMSVFGYDEENTSGLRATTVPVTLNIRESGFVGDDPPIPPTPDLYTQLLQKINENSGANGRDGKDGADGKSAYDLAVDEGYEGTLSEWLLSLKGKDGHDGLNGKDGIDGVNGKDGRDGIDGKDGADGVNGKDGRDGKSAYQIAVDNGFSGTVTEWVSSLKGADGKDTPDMQQYIDSINNDMNVLTEQITSFELTIHELRNKIDSLEHPSVVVFGAEKEPMYFGVIYNGGYHVIGEFFQLYPHFYTEQKELSYNMTDFGWDGEVLIICETPYTLTEKSRLSITYISGATEDAYFYIVPKADNLTQPVTMFVKDKIDVEYAARIRFQWLQTDSFITTLVDINAVGEYYIAWVGRSNNTHPVIKEIKIQEG